MAFWDTFKKTAAVGSLAAGAIGATAMGIKSIISSKHKRKLEERQMQINERQQSQSEKKDMLNQEIKLKELELRQREIDSNAYVDLAKTQMNTQADVQTASIKGSADVQKAQVMYGANGINNNSMFYDRENGIMVDNRNISVNTGAGMGMMSVNYAQVAQANNMSINHVQEKLLNAQSLLKQNLITPEEFNKIKSEILKEVF